MPAVVAQRYLVRVAPIVSEAETVDEQANASVPHARLAREAQRAVPARANCAAGGGRPHVHDRLATAIREPRDSAAVEVEVVTSDVIVVAAGSDQPSVPG